jgi:hypothetical protein
MRATGIGSMPGDDFADALHTVLGEVVTCRSSRSCRRAASTPE